MWSAVLVLSAALYPYVYILARAAFAEQSGATYEVARALGQGPWGVFRRVGLPLARPAIAAGVALALMETVADYGTVHHFGVQTLTTGIFSTWLDGGNAGGAAQIAGVILTLIFVLAPGLLAALGNTLTVAGLAALATVAAAVFLVYGIRLAGRGAARAVLPSVEGPREWCTVCGAT